MVIMTYITVHLKEWRWGGRRFQSLFMNETNIIQHPLKKIIITKTRGVEVLSDADLNKSYIVREVFRSGLTIPLNYPS